MLNNLSINDLLRAVREYNEDIVYTVKKAYDMASTLHQNQYRKSGEPYIIHPLNVCYTLALMHADCDTLCAALLHDTLEDTHVTKEEIAKEFNENVAELVDGVTKISNSTYNVGSDNDATTRKIILGMAKDIRIIVIKLADRLHNMRTLEFKSPDRQEKISLETMHLYVPLARIIGAYEIKYELEDIAFKYLKPNDYLKTEEERNRLIDTSKSTLDIMQSNIGNLLEQKDISYSIYGKVKNIYGIYKRINKLGNYTDKHDLVALKICLEELQNCYLNSYLVLGLVHKLYHPLNEKFKDYICNPKANMYQALHTTVFAPNDSFVQVQIKTTFMNYVSTYGLPSYWHYMGDMARYKMQEDLTNKINFYDSVEGINQLFSSNQDFVNQVRKEILSKNIHVFNSKGSVIYLPSGSTIVDYLLTVYKDKAIHVDNVSINGNLSSNYGQVLNDNDIICVSFDESKVVNTTSWEKMTATSLGTRTLSLIKKGN